MQKVQAVSTRVRTRKNHTQATKNLSKNLRKSLNVARKAFFTCGLSNHGFSMFRQTNLSFQYLPQAINET